MGLANATAPAAKDERKPDVPMPLGTQQATVVHTMTKSSVKGKLGFAIKFQDEAERSSWATLWVSPESPKAMEVLSKQMAAMGLTESFLNDDKTTAEEIAEAMIGAKALVTVVDEEYNGKTYRKISWIA